ncbi:hypothetical protein SAMN04487914_12342 [Arthrobacter sp. ok909]|uniref:hypothetical protein n=1 Tax=Arthrobacter sp. ok909 TaxID=1761746 RepID=UPI0008839C5E|nr:hypothetical protein [Arthrobacter sp. ok909]SDP65055.1 hypothetical protein SAMN04487914_12342 [Arthrobacter sp. ok909]
MIITPTTDSAAEFQYVPVPNEHVRAVLVFLGERLSTTAVTAATPIEPTAEDAVVTDQEAIDGWSDENLIKFFAMGTKTSVIVERMLRHLSGHPGRDEALSTRELAKALDLDYSVMKNIPTQVARTLGKHFPGLTWPWCAQSGPKFTPPRANEVFFWVTGERAAQLKHLRG